MAIPSRAKPGVPVTPQHGSSLSAFLGQARSGLTACQGTTDAVTGLLLAACRLGLSPGTQHGFHGNPCSENQAAHAGQQDPRQRVPSSIVSLCLCQGLRSVPRAWGQRLAARILQSIPRLHGGKPPMAWELCSTQGQPGIPVGHGCRHLWGVHLASLGLWLWRHISTKHPLSCSERGHSHSERDQRLESKP